MHFHPNRTIFIFKGMEILDRRIAFWTYEAGIADNKKARKTLNLLEVGHDRTSNCDIATLRVSQDHFSVFLVLWEISIILGWIDNIMIPKPTSIAGSIFKLYVTQGKYMNIFS